MTYRLLALTFSPIISQAVVYRQRDLITLSRNSSSHQGCGDAAWSCPASWTTGESPGAPADARAFIAVHNIYRCMHNVQAVQWDTDVFTGANNWANHIGGAMQHASYGTAHIANSDGENLAGTYPFSAHQGVDAAHMWYQEIEAPCSYSQQCFQSFNAGHFTAMIWKTVSKVAYADPTGQIAVGRYRGCDGNPPNFNNAYAAMVPPPVKNWETCKNLVFACPTFSGLTDEHVEGCDSSGACCRGAANGGWFVNYGTTCQAKYADVHTKITAMLNVSGITATDSKKIKSFLQGA